jgi:hypothetical protein
VGLELGIAFRSASLLPVFAVVAVLSGCTSEGNSGQSVSPPVETSKPVYVIVAGPIRPRELRSYLSAWEASWQRLVGDLQSGEDEGALGYSSTPDASWERARRLYEGAATALQEDADRLDELTPPSVMQKVHDAYLAAVRRQQARFEAVANAFAGTDPQELDDALMALQASQMKFDLDGAAWEGSVIAACRASGVEVPEFVRQELISNGQRTRTAEK